AFFMLNEWKDALNSGDLQLVITSTIGQILLWILALVLLLVIAIVSGRKQTTKVKVKQLVYSAIAITIATVFSFVKFITLPQGGSITLFSMLFVVLIGYWYGVKQGLLSGMVFGILQLILQGWVLHPIQLILDYPLAFAMLGLSGLFKNSENGLLKGLILGAFGRFLCHFISGIVFFGSYAIEGFSTAAYSAAYNIAYVGGEVFLTAILIMIPALDQALKTIKKAAISD
ncbi:MAG: energy-coupled thiamine transporter ThiT, partial [Vallitaleaceae bacterium]|nr:energy-coupled thiamine transporter ThiT [Vallitaleaceae bacterium]